jgi:hypothetical protein
MEITAKDTPARAQAVMELRLEPRVRSFAMNVIY